MISVRLIKAFTNDPVGGNPAGVVIDASNLSDEQMLHIATDLNFSESAFIFPSDKADYRVRFFAISGEVDYCGHATIATYLALFNLPENSGKSTLTQETKAGVFTISMLPDGRIMMQQNSPVYGDIESNISSVTDMLGLDDTDLQTNAPIQVVKTNVAKLIVPIASIKALQGISPDINKITDYTNGHSGKGLYCFAKSEDPEYDFVARFFNPAIGINEDPATGVAAGPLGCYAEKYLSIGSKKQIIINQGMWMGKSSVIYVDLNEKVAVGGYAVEFGFKTYDI